MLHYKIEGDMYFCTNSGYINKYFPNKTIQKKGRSNIRKEKLLNVAEGVYKMHTNICTDCGKIVETLRPCKPYKCPNC